MEFDALGHGSRQVSYEIGQQPVVLRVGFEGNDPLETPMPFLEIRTNRVAVVRPAIDEHLVLSAVQNARREVWGLAVRGGEGVVIEIQTPAELVEVFSTRFLVCPQ